MSAFALEISRSDIKAAIVIKISHRQGIVTGYALQFGCPITKTTVAIAEIDQNFSLLLPLAIRSEWPSLFKSPTAMRVGSPSPFISLAKTKPPKPSPK